MTKLPPNPQLLKLYRNGLSDAEIAEEFDASVQAVNARFVAMGIRRAPYRAKVASIAECAWPIAETRRGEFTNRGRHRDFLSFLRWRLGDPEVSENLVRSAKRFERAIRQGNCVMDFQPESDEPWPFVPREPSDGRMVIRWPKDRDLPQGDLRAALDLPPDEPEK